jgi:LacI family transcriptional regulator
MPTSTKPTKPQPPKPKTASIRDVALLAGVSLGSASRVINNVDNVSAETRRKVSHAIAELGYSPNHAAQSLRMRSTRTIGCMLTDVTNPLYAKLFRAVEERFRKAGYMVLLANSLNNPQWEIDILAMFKSRGMDGVLIAPGNERNQEVLAAVEGLGIPTVILDRDMVTTTDRVQFDHVPGMKSVVSHLIGLGHKDIALIVAQMPNRPMRRRMEGFRGGFKAHGLEPPEHLILQMPTSMSSAYKDVSALLSLPRRPTAIVAMGTSILNETLNAIHAHGLRIPKDISVVAIGDPDFARSYMPPISVLRVDPELAAEESATLLLDRIQRHDRSDPRSVKVPTDLIIRGSCGPVPVPGTQRGK